MKGYTIQKSIDLLEKSIETSGGSGEAPSASDVSYDNTSSGLTGTNVQSAINELALRFNISTTESVIGKWGDEILYAKLVDCGELPDRTTKTVDPQISDLKDVKNIIPIIGYAEDPTFCEFAGKLARFQARSTGISIVTTETWAGYTCTMLLMYTKNQPTRKSTKKK